LAGAKTPGADMMHEAAAHSLQRHTASRAD